MVTIMGSPVSEVNRFSGCHPSDTIGMTISKRIRQARKLAGMTQMDLAAKSGLKQSTISDLEVGKSQGSTSVASLAQAMGVNPLWLESGKGPMTINGDAEPGINPFQAVDIYSHSDNPNVLLIPKVQIRAAGGITGFAIDGSDDVDLETYPLEKSWVERNRFSVERLLAMRVKGDSMFPLYKPGDVIVVNTADKSPADTKEFVVNFDGDVVLKRLSKDGGLWWLTSDNPEPKYHRRSFKSGETIIIGRVVKHDRIDL